MSALPIKRLQGIGKVTEMIMGGLGIFTCQDMVDKATEIFLNFTENVFEFLIKSALGIGKNTHDDSCQIKKSLSVAETFKPLNNLEDIQAKMVQLAKELYQKCVTECLFGRAINMEYKTTQLVTKQKSYTLQIFSDKEEELVNLALRLLNQVWPVQGLRMMGLKLMDIMPMDPQLFSFKVLQNKAMAAAAQARSKAILASSTADLHQQQDISQASAASGGCVNMHSNEHSSSRCENSQPGGQSSSSQTNCNYNLQPQSDHPDSSVSLTPATTIANLEDQGYRKVFIPREQLQKYQKIDINNRKRNQTGITRFIESDYGQFIKNKQIRQEMLEQISQTMPQQQQQFAGNPYFRRKPYRSYYYSYSNSYQKQDYSYPNRLPRIQTGSKV